MRTDHQHREAFALMNYACKCGHREVIWNSRDGVAPFGTACPSCGKPTLTHVEWQRDVYAPDHKPFRYQRFWRDGTPDEAEAIVRRRISLFKDQYPVSAKDLDEMIAVARAGLISEFQKGWPMLDQSSFEDRK